MKLKITSEDKELKRKFIEIKVKKKEENDIWFIFEAVRDELDNNSHKYIDTHWDITSVTVMVKRKKYTCKMEFYHEDCCQCGGYTEVSISNYYKDGEEVEL